MTAALGTVGTVAWAATSKPGLASDSLSELTAAIEQLTTVEQQIAVLTPQLPPLLAATQAAERDLIAVQTLTAQLTAEQKTAAQRAANAQILVDRLALATYVSDDRGPVEQLLTAQNPVEAAERRILSRSVSNDRTEALDELVAARAGLDAEALAAANQLVTAQSALNAAASAQAAKQAEITAAQALRVELIDKIADLRISVVAFQSATVVPDSDIPLIALSAYQRAAHFVGQVNPGCAITWWHIAGIGKQESNHGRFAGSVPQPGGDVVPVIRGIALDGTRSLAIADTDGGVLDGDTVWDRALGPTQFIPSTWRSYARLFDLDGDKDGSEDPDNMYDAARATAFYLCRNSPGPITDQANYSRAIWAYNPNTLYNVLVLRHAARYQATVVPDLEGFGLPPSSPGIVAPPLPPPTSGPPTSDLTPGALIDPVTGLPIVSDTIPSNSTDTTVPDAGTTTNAPPSDSAAPTAPTTPPAVDTTPPATGGAG
jgi:membrane-bound lytic murein transglycosylase B